MKNPVPTHLVENLLDQQYSLSDQKSCKLLGSIGENRLLGPKPRRFEILMNTLKDPMIWFLVFAASLFFIAGERNEAIVLLVAIFPIIGLDSFLHRRTALSTASLANNLSVNTSVFRNGRLTTIDTTKLVPGDLVMVSMGEYVPADAIILADKHTRLQVDESSLSGEVDPVLKTPLRSIDTLKGEDPLVDHKYWLFAGCRVVSGNALARVIYTGTSTIYGDLIRTAKGEKNEKTILQKSIYSLILRMLAVSLALCIFLAYMRIAQGNSYTDAFMSAAVLALAALPEEFPIVFSFYLGYSIFRLSRHKILVRHAAGVEHMGRVSVVCADKTGTITQGALTLEKIIAAKGYTEEEVLRCARLATQGSSVDPLDLAILQKAPGCEFSNALSVLPFNEKNKYEQISYKVAEKESIIATKGAPEILIQASNLSEIDRQENMAIVSKYAAKGYKLIACMMETQSNTDLSLSPQLAGYLCFQDPIKTEVFAAINACKTMGVRVIMVTGDHYQTAINISEKIGIYKKGVHRGLSADENVDWLKVAQDHKVTVIARALPRDKYNLVRALKAQGDVTAVTGDGVNDILALKAADVSLVMGERGTKGARDIASMVLMDDNFKAIINAMIEGKSLFANLKKSYIYLMTIHFPFVISSALLPALGYPIVFLPIHVVLIEIILHPTSLLCFHKENATNDQAEQFKSVKKLSHGFFQKRDLVSIVSLGVLSTALICILFDFTLAHENTLAARSLAFYQMAFFSIALAFSIDSPVGRNAKLIAVFILLGVCIFQLSPHLAEYFDIGRLRVTHLVILIGANLGFYALNKMLLDSKKLLLNSNKKSEAE